MTIIMENMGNCKGEGGSYLAKDGQLCLGEIDTSLFSSPYICLYLIAKSPAD
jgi:hypothetical protein